MEPDLERLGAIRGMQKEVRQVTNTTLMPMPVVEPAARRAFVTFDARPHAAISGFGMPFVTCSWSSHLTTNAVANTPATKGLKAYGARRHGDAST